MYLYKIDIHYSLLYLLLMLTKTFHGEQDKARMRIDLVNRRVILSIRYMR